MATRVHCLRDKRVRDMVVAGERCCAESVTWGMIESSDSLRGFDLCDFQFTEMEAIFMDPGGMLMCEDQVREIESHGVVIRFYQQNAGYVVRTFHPEMELQERLPNWYRIGVFGGNVYIPKMIRESLYRAAVAQQEEHLEKIRLDLRRLEEQVKQLLGKGTKSAKMAADLIQAKLDRRRMEIEFI